jgi:hypothetical protein
VSDGHNLKTSSLLRLGPQPRNGHPLLGRALTPLEHAKRNRTILGHVLRGPGELCLDCGARWTHLLIKTRKEFEAVCSADVDLSEEVRSE